MIQTDSVLPRKTASKSQHPLRIAFFTETFLPRIDGTVTRMCHTIRHLRRLGHELLIVAPKSEVTEFEGTRVVGVPGIRFPLYPELKVSPPHPSIAKPLVAFRPHLIHAFHPVLLGISAHYFSTTLRLPLAISYHSHVAEWLPYYGLGALRQLTWWGLMSSYNRGDLVLVTSKCVQDLLLERKFQRVQLWRRGVDTDLFTPQRASRKMRERLTGGRPEEKLLLYVGRLSAEKSIELCRPVLDALPGLRLALVGDGPDRSRLEQLFAGTPTVFTGYLKGTELAAAYASADVFFLPSQTETLGLVLLEAMAAGCPVVAAAAGGVFDIVRDGVTGRLFKAGNAESAVSALRPFLEDSNYRNALSLQARLEAEQWGWEAATRQLESFYLELLRREPQLTRQIGQEMAAGKSAREICGALHISRATFRRHQHCRPLLEAPVGVIR